MRFIQELEQRLRAPLPGADAQWKMSHAIRRNDLVPPTNARHAAVMALFYPKNDAWNLVLIERVAHENDQHSGQIGFPGGKVEHADPSLEAAALREVEEEIGVSRQGIEVLGPLTPLYIPVSNFQVHPFIGFSETTPSFTLQPTEVASILEVAVQELQHPEVVRTTNLTVANNLVLRNVPYYHLQDRIVWGATAMMLSELLTITPQPS